VPKRKFTLALVGVGLAVLAMTFIPVPAAAISKPVTAPKAQPGGALPAGFSDWNAVYAFQSRLDAAAEQIAAADRTGNASIVAGPANRELRVYWHGAVPRKLRTLAAGLDVPVAFRPAQFPHSQLVHQARRLAADPRVAAVAPTADGSGLAATVAASMPVTARAALQAATTVPVTITVGDGPQPGAGRQSDTPVFWGGSRYNTTSGGCTNGIPVRVGSVYDMLSAGHCGNDGDAANVPGQPTPTGTLLGKNGCRDNVLINYPSGSAPRIYTGVNDSSSSVAVLGATIDFVGNLVATGGATSGEHLNIPVTQTDVFIHSTAACTTSIGPLTEASFTTDTCATARGDSGGPVYSYVGANVVGRGTVYGGNFGTATCPGGVGTQGSRTLFYAPLFRPASDPEIGSLDYYQAAPPPATTFNLSGRWNSSAGPFISVNETNISVDMSTFGRPTAHGTVLDNSTISVTFPDAGTFTAQLISPGTLRWSNGSSWSKIAALTSFDLNGKWSGGHGPGPFISVNGTSISVDMSAFGRPTAHGTVVNNSTISVTFPDAGTVTGQLLAPNEILWSNHSLWTKI
jgi:hypothetical protein